MTSSLSFTNFNGMLSIVGWSKMIYRDIFKLIVIWSFDALIFILHSSKIDFIVLTKTREYRINLTT